MNTTLKIQYGDSLEEAVLKLSENNIGAGKALIEIAQASRSRPLPPALEAEVQTLPEFAKDQEQEIRQGLAEMHPLLSLDEAGVHGPLIWMLYKDTCGEKPDKVCALLEQYENGSLSREDLHQKIQTRERSCQNRPAPSEVGMS